MKSEEDQYISTGNQLQSSDAAPEDARCSPANISPERVSPNSQSPIGPPTCGPVVSVSLVKQSCNDYQILQGVTSIKTEDHTAEIHSQEGGNQKERRPTDCSDYWQVIPGLTIIKSEDPLVKTKHHTAERHSHEGFQPSDETCHQQDRRPTEPHIQVKTEKAVSNECTSNSSTPTTENGALSSVATREDGFGPLTDFQSSILLRLQGLEEAVAEMMQLLRSQTGISKAAEELDDVLPANTTEELGRLCERLADQNFKKQLTCYLTSLGGHNIKDTVRRILGKVGTNALWCSYSLKGKKGKIAFIELPVARLINRACLKNHPKATICDVETELAECLKHAPMKRGGSKYKTPAPKRIKRIKCSVSSSPSDMDD